MTAQRFVVSDVLWQRLEPYIPGTVSDAGATILWLPVRDLLASAVQAPGFVPFDRFYGFCVDLTDHIPSDEGVYRPQINSLIRTVRI
jgi:hypothetical protein